MEQLANDIQTLTKHVSALERLVRQLGTRKDNQQLREELKDTREQSKNLQKMIHVQIKTVSVSSPPERARLDKLTKTFRDVVKTFERVSNESVRKEREIVMAISASLNGEAPIHQVAGGEEIEVDGRQVFIPSGAQASAAAIQKRNEEISQLEQDVVQCAEMFQDLAFLVKQQDEQIELIVDNVSQAKQQVQAGQMELEKAHTNMKKARNKKCLLLVLLLVILIIIVVPISVVYAS